MPESEETDLELHAAKIHLERFQPCYERASRSSRQPDDQRQVFGERFRVTLKANDPEAVKSIQLNPSLGSGEIVWSCKAPAGGENAAQNKSATLGSMTQNLSPDAEGNVLTSILLIQEVDFTLQCQSCWTFTSGNRQINRAGEQLFWGHHD